MERLNRRWDVVATDVCGEGILALDVTDSQACREMSADADAVIHLAAVPDPDASWEVLLPANVIGAYCVATAAMAAGVRRLVLASSLQAVSAYRDDTQVRAGDPPRPANLYGATKAWAEALGSWVAATSAVEVVAVRIGNYLDVAPAGPGVSARDKAAWLSPTDCAQLMQAAVEGPADGFVVVNGISANRYRKAEYGTAEQHLGYRPRDDAWTDS